MSDTPETNNLLADLLSELGTIGRHNCPERLVVHARKLERERDEAREQDENLKLQLRLWEDGNLISEETLGEIRLLNEQINGAFRERDEAIELLKIAAWYSTTTTQEMTEKFLRKIGKWEGAK